MKRRHIIYRITGCPHCMGYNKVPWDLWRYRCGHCGHCGRPIDGTPDPALKPRSLAGKTPHKPV